MADPLELDDEDDDDDGMDMTDEPFMRIGLDLLLC